MLLKTLMVSGTFSNHILREKEEITLDLCG